MKEGCTYPCHSRIPKLGRAEILSVKAVALTTGVLWAGYVLLIGIANLADPQYAAGFLALLRSLYGLHFAHQWENLTVTTICGFVDGAIGGSLFAWIYDYFADGSHSEASRLMAGNASFRNNPRRRIHHELR